VSKLRAASRRRAKSIGDVLERYFEALREQDWRALADTLAPDVHRTGPYLDEVRGRETYVAFLAGVIPTLRGYALDVARIRALEDGGAIVELSESMDREGSRITHPEALLFEFDAAGRIARVDVYLKQPPR
jgi:limonene-1,2-epoxide hydrolase